MKTAAAVLIGDHDIKEASLKKLSKTDTEKNTKKTLGQERFMKPAFWNQLF